MSLTLDDQPLHPAAPSDEELLDRIRDGDEASFGVLYRRYYGVARRYAMRLSSPSVPADDVVSEAFLSVLSAVQGGAGPRDGFRLYLFTAVRRTAQRFRAAGLPTPVAPETIQAPGVVDHHPLGGLDDADLEAALLELPARWRDVLGRLEVDGVDLRDVAREFGLSKSATSALAYRARRALRAAYLQQLR